jgi:hypothetical protein
MSRAVEKLAGLLAARLEPPARVRPHPALTAVTPEQLDLALQLSRWRRRPVSFGHRGREVPR